MLRVVVNQRPTLDHFIRYHLPAVRKCRQQTHGKRIAWLGEPRAWR